MTDAQQTGLSDSTKRLLAVTAAVIVIVVAVVIYGLVFARHNAA
jgi:Flp pilus assembly protein TadB